MRHLLTLAAAALLPLASSHALEAVAQQPYWQNGGKNLTASLKVDAVGTRIVHLSETITEILACNEDGKLFDGTHCVAPAAVTIPNCGDGYYISSNSSGFICRAMPTPSTPPSTPVTATIAIPPCTPSQTLVVKDGELACKDAPTYGLVPGWPDAIKCWYKYPSDPIARELVWVHDMDATENMSYGETQVYHTLAEHDGKTGYVVYDTKTGAYKGYKTVPLGSCAGKSIHQLIKEGRAFKFMLPFQE